MNYIDPTVLKLVPFCVYLTMASTQMVKVIFEPKWPDTAATPEARARFLQLAALIGGEAWFWASASVWAAGVPWQERIELGVVCAWTASGHYDWLTALFPALGAMLARMTPGKTP